MAVEAESSCTRLRVSVVEVEPSASTSELPSESWRGSMEAGEGDRTSRHSSSLSFPAAGLVAVLASGSSTGAAKPETGGGVGGDIGDGCGGGGGMKSCAVGAGAAPRRVYLWRRGGRSS